MNFLIIPEDFRKDQYILKPLFQKLLVDLGKARARVVVCNPPLLGGVTEALKSERLSEVVKIYPMVDVFILCVDRDGQKGRRRRLNDIEVEFNGPRIFIAENAWEEIETWILAGLTLPSDWNWNEIRRSVDVKERFFEPYARSVGVADGPGGGRKALGEAASKRIDAIILKCKEDFGVVADRLKAIV